MRNTNLGAFQKISHVADPSNLMEAADYWAKGIPLDQAAWHFAPPKLRARFAEAETARDRQWMKTPAHEAELTSQNTEPLETLMDMVRADSAVSSAFTEMRESVCRQIRNGKLVPTGYVTPRDASDLPVKVPIDLIDWRVLDWAKSTACGAGLQFTSIRITRAKCDIQPLVHSQPQIGGRPSKRQMILDAIKNISASKRNKSASSSITVEEIREHIARQNPRKKPPCIKTIKTHMRAISAS